MTYSMQRDSALRPIKILHVIHGLQRGGLENGVVNLLNHLPADQFEQAVCCLDQRGEMADRIQREVPIVVLDRGRHDLRVPLRLARLLRELRPDIIHCRNWNAWPDTVAAHWLSGRRATLVWSFHGFTDRDWLPLRRRLASRVLARATNHLFAVCHDAARRYASASGLAERRFDVLYNGVDMSRFAPSQNREELRSQLGFKPDEMLVLTVANLIPVKDHSSLVQAIAALPAMVDNPRVRVLFLGEGGLRPHLEQQIAELGLTRQVSLLGKSDQVADYLAAADVFVLPSRLEGMSNAILEAMASGLPVIARRVGGNPELVVDGNTGLLCEPDDVADLSAAISRLITDGELRLQMGQAARQRAHDVFSIKAMMMAYGHFYRRIATGQP